MLFVHGSGDMPRDAYGYYESFWRLFASKGWCSVAWDKPGVAGSGGDWRAQSMAERADEVTAAIDFVRRTRLGEEGRIGLIGFSQAGWVMPKVIRQRQDIDFMIVVSGAINWLQQSRYSGRMRMLAEGLSQSQIEAQERDAKRIDDLIRSDASYATYLGQAGAEPMSAALWRFAKRNWDNDASADLHAIDVPVLALFGTHDAYVDPTANAAAYQRALARSAAPFFSVRIFDNADHGLMQADEIKPTHKGMDAWMLLLRIWLEGDDVFAPGVLECVAGWMERLAAKDRAEHAMVTEEKENQ